MGTTNSASSDGVAGAPPLKLVVGERRIVSDDVVALDLYLGDGTPLPQWTPGAHIDLHLDGLVRQYSLCGDPAATDRWTIGVLREQESRGGSQFVHDVLHPGVTVVVSAPRNHFAFDQAAGDYIFIAGGIGITPLLPMLRAAEASSAPWRLHFGGRSLRSMPFRAEIEHDPRVQIYPDDVVGPLPLDAILDEAGESSVVYCCGPTGLLEAAISAAARHSVPIHVEHFRPVEREGLTSDDSFEVELAASGLTVTVPKDRSILEVAEDAGAVVVSSCSEGTCGTCETRVLAGIPEHRDSILTDEVDSIMICVSRALSPRLVLDL